jgi:fructokinase
VPDVYLGIDLGTSELKLALLEGHRLVASVGEPVITARPQPHWVEQNPADWWMALDAAMLRMRAAHPVAMAGVRAIGPSGQMHGAVLLDVGQRCWSDELLSACHLTCAQMPRLIEGSDVSGQLRPALADRWGLRPGLCVAGGGGDNAASAVGIGAVQPNQGFISLGTDAPTTLGLVGLDAQGVPKYTFYGEGAADRQLELDAFRLLPAKLRAIHIGSFATVVEPIASTVRALVERERSRTLICYDPNVRLNVEPDLDRWRDMLQWMLSRTHLLKISEEDLALLRPGMGTTVFIQDALAHGVGLVIVTQGKHGAQAATRSVSVSVPAAAARCVDTVGAGDAFQAAMLSWLAEHERLSPEAIAATREDQLIDALRFAAAAAALTCARRGADLPRREELEAQRREA